MLGWREEWKGTDMNGWGGWASDKLMGRTVGRWGEGGIVEWMGEC